MQQTVCQNTLFAGEELGIQQITKFLPREHSLDIFTARAAAFHASEYRNCISYDLFCNKTLKASFLLK